MNERIVYEALAYHALPAVANSSRHASSRGVSLRNWEFLCCYMKRLIIRNGAQFKFHLPGVFAWSFVLRLEHLAVRITPTIKHSLKFQQEGVIE